MGIGLDMIDNHIENLGFTEDHWIDEMAQEDVNLANGVRIVEQYKMHSLFWETRDGDKIHIYEMKDDHLENCLRMVKSQRSTHNRAWVQVFEAEKLRRRYQLKQIA